MRVESSFHASGGIFLPIERTVLHDSFDYGSPGIDYDYGLIKLVARFERAVPVRLVAPYRRFPPGELCTVVGWGMTKKTGDREQLRMVRLPIVRQEVCKEIYEGWETITRRMICAGYAAGGQDACEVREDRKLHALIAFKSFVIIASFLSFEGRFWRTVAVPWHPGWHHLVGCGLCQSQPLRILRKCCESARLDTEAHGSVNRFKIHLPITDHH